MTSLASASRFTLLNPNRFAMSFGCEARSCGETPARPPRAATPGNHATEIYWSTRSAVAVTVYFEYK